MSAKNYEDHVEKILSAISYLPVSEGYDLVYRVIQHLLHIQGSPGQSHFSNIQTAFSLPLHSIHTLISNYISWGHRDACIDAFCNFSSKSVTNYASFSEQGTFSNIVYEESLNLILLFRETIDLPYLRHCIEYKLLHEIPLDSNYILLYLVHTYLGGFQLKFVDMLLKAYSSDFDKRYITPSKVDFSIALLDTVRCNS